MKDVVVKLIAKEVGLSVCDVKNLVEVPPRAEMGDFAFPCFGLAKLLKKSPVVIAGDLAKKFKLPKGIDRVGNEGGYVNFFVDKKVLAEKVLAKVKKKGFGSLGLGKGKKVVIDMSSPNIAKPFGIGHLRSTMIGNSIGKIAEANGFDVVKINYLGDWGTQFGKMIYAWKTFRKDTEKEADMTELLALYVEFHKEAEAKKEIEEYAREEFRKLESGDKKNLKLWEEFRELSLKEFDKIYNFLGVEFDVVSGESLYNDKMTSVVGELKKKGIAKEDEGALIVDMKDEGLGVALIQKKDGTSLYATRDLAAAEDRKKEYNFVRMIYEVGAEQKLHFRQLFKILEKMGNKWAKDCVHAAHGLYLDKDGKKFSTRKGKTVYMKDILDEVVVKAKGNLVARGTGSSEDELDRRARIVALAAILYGDLKNNKEHNIVFDVDRFLSFEGDTGPYLLYSYARASSIIRKVNSKSKVEIGEPEESEIKLLKKINGLEEVVRRAYEGLAPNLVANYCFELAKDFNEFYHACPVLGSESEGFRLALVGAFRVTLEKGLDLLGIEKMDEM